MSEYLDKLQKMSDENYERLRDEALTKFYKDIEEVAMSGQPPGKRNFTIVYEEQFVNEIVAEAKKIGLKVFNNTYDRVYKFSW